MTISALSMIMLIVVLVLQVVSLFARWTETDRVSSWLCLAAGIILLGVTIYRSILIRFVAITNTWESLIFFAGVLSLVLFILSRRPDGLSPAVTFGGGVIALVFLAMASSPIASPVLMPPIPALQSHWLVLHVVFSFIGEAFFTVSFISAVIWLLSPGDRGRRDRAEGLMYTALAAGYPLFTAGALVFGAVWAEYAWGSFWSWDPKETWALVTWLIFTACLHLRYIRGVKGRAAVWLVIVGFLLMMFTFFGVNFFLSSLHSYG